MEIIRTEGNTYGYATIDPRTDGTYEVRRLTYGTPFHGSDGVTLQAEAVVLDEDEARALAAQWAAITGPALRRAEAQHCHWCGLPLSRYGACRECGQQF